MKLKQITACLVAATMFGSNPVFAQSAPKVSGDVIKIGVLTDTFPQLILTWLVQVR